MPSRSEHSSWRSPTAHAHRGRGHRSRSPHTNQARGMETGNRNDNSTRTDTRNSGMGVTHTSQEGQERLAQHSQSRLALSVRINSRTPTCVAQSELLLQRIDLHPVYQSPGFYDRTTQTSPVVSRGHRSHGFSHGPHQATQMRQSPNHPSATCADLPDGQQ